ncbi:MAG: hypothetical protein EA358_05015 [Flavobacteriales bacterium]|nr:MAG: hypothetical protein EA358_05015 [Flavobacteriales bacterium]
MAINVFGCIFEHIYSQILPIMIRPIPASCVPQSTGFIAFFRAVKSVSVRGKCFGSLIFIWAFFSFQPYVSATSFPGWYVSLVKSGGNCELVDFEVISSFTQNPPNQRSNLEVQIQWRLVGNVTWNMEPIDTLPIGQLQGSIYSFQINPNTPPTSSTLPVNIEYRVQVSLAEPAQRYDNVSVETHIVDFGTLSAQGVPEISEARIHPTTLAYEVSKCAPQIHTFDFNSTNVPLGSIQVQIFESDANANYVGGQIFLPTSTIWSRPSDPRLNLSSLANFQNNFNDAGWYPFISQNSGYFIVEVHYEDYCLSMSNVEFLHVYIDTTSPTVNFYMSMEDPAAIFNAQKVILGTSQNPLQPIEVSLTGRVHVDSIAPNYSTFEIVFSKYSNNTHTVVGNYITDSFPIGTKSFSVFRPDFYFSFALNPSENLDSVYKVEVFKRTDNCVDASYYSYFKALPAYFGFRTGQSFQSMNDYHSRIGNQNALLLHIDPAHSLSNSESFIARITSLDGKIIAERSGLEAGDNQIDLPQVSKGMYLIQSFNRDGQLIYAGKFQF